MGMPTSISSGSNTTSTEIEELSEVWK